MAETPLVRLVALGPGTQLYGTRALIAGDQFEMSREWADILIRIGKARLADEKQTSTAEAVQTEKAEAKTESAAAVAKPSVTASSNEQLDQLRNEARQLGINVDGRWTEVRLSHEIAQAKRK